MMQQQLFNVEAERDKEKDASVADHAEEKKRGQKREWKVSSPDEINRIINRAILDGTHSPTCKVVCQQCGEWVSGFFHHYVDSHKWVCILCARKNGLAAAQVTKSLEELAIVEASPVTAEADATPQGERTELMDLPPEG